MSFLRKLFGKSVPQWASFFSPEEFAAFRAAVTADIAARTNQYRVDAKEGTIHAVVPGGPPEPRALGLLNVAQMCGRSEREQWPEVIHRHFDSVFSFGTEQENRIEALAEDWDQARKVLRVRLQPGDYGAELGETVVSQPVAEDLKAVLVYDFPDSVATVHQNHIAKWGVPLNDLIQTGLRNVRAEGLLKPDRWALGEGMWVDLYEDYENFYAASHVLLLHEYYDPEPELGLLVSVPTRHTMIIHPIRDAEALDALRAFLHITPAIFDRGPGSLSPNLYWSRHGVFTHLPYQRQGDTPLFFPPTSFQQQVLERLAEDEENAEAEGT